MKSNNFKTESCLDEYQNAINNKDLQLIKELNIKYSQNNLNDVVYELYLYKRYNLINISFIVKINITYTSSSHSVKSICLNQLIVYQKPLILFIKFLCKIFISINTFLYPYLSSTNELAVKIPYIIY